MSRYIAEILKSIKVDVVMKIIAGLLLNKKGTLHLVNFSAKTMRCKRPVCFEIASLEQRYGQFS